MGRREGRRNNISRSAIFCPSDGTLSELIVESPRLAGGSLGLAVGINFTREREKRREKGGGEVEKPLGEGGRTEGSGAAEQNDVEDHL